MPKTSDSHHFKLVHDGITLKCELIVPPRASVDHIEDMILRLGHFIQNPSEQTKLEFDEQTVLNGCTIRADQPKAGDREFSFTVTVTGAPMTDRSTIFNHFQAGNKLTFKISEEKSKKKGKGKDKPAEAQQDEPTQITDIKKGDADPLPRETLIELALRRALAPITDLRVAGEEPNPMSDSDISMALKKAWSDPQTGFCEGYHYSAYGSQGAKKEPRFWLSEVIETSTNVTSKPTLAGQPLIVKVRELLEIPNPAKKGTKRTTIH